MTPPSPPISSVSAANFRRPMRTSLPLKLPTASAIAGLAVGKAMRLRRQLLLVSLLLLSLPWAGCQFIREMEGALRHGQAQSLQATARAIAAVLGEQEGLLY